MEDVPPYHMPFTAALWVNTQHALGMTGMRIAYYLFIQIWCLIFNGDSFLLTMRRARVFDLSFANDHETWVPKMAFLMFPESIVENMRKIENLALTPGHTFCKLHLM